MDNLVTIFKGGKNDQKNRILQQKDTKQSKRHLINKKKIETRNQSGWTDLAC